MPQEAAGRITGNIRVEDRRDGRTWVAAFITADGRKTRRSLGPAWIKDSGKRTARGAVVWRAASGAKPTPLHLTPKEAQDALEAILAAEKGKPRRVAAKSRVTLGEASEKWLEHAKTVGGKRGVLSTSTARGYQDELRGLHEVLPSSMDLSKLTAVKVRQAQEWLLTETREHTKRPLSRSKSRQIMQRLRQVLTFAVERGWVADNVANAVDLPSVEQAEPDFNVLEPSQVEAVAREVALLTDEERPLLRNGSDDARMIEAMVERRELYADAVRVLAYTGLRAGELRSLRWRDVDFANATLHVRRNAPTSVRAELAVKRPKSGKGRSVPLVPQAAVALERVSRTHGTGGAEQAVFPTRTGEMLDLALVRRAFYRGLKAAGLGHMREGKNPMTMHDLRHTFATVALRSGCSLVELQAWLGHADIQTTMRYAHYVPRHDAASRLGAAFGADLNPLDAAPPLAAAG